MQDILMLIYNLPKLIVYLYPGYITIYIYKFCRGITVRNTKSEILQSICLSYIYVAFIGKVPSQNEWQRNLILIVVSSLVGYIAYVVSTSGYFNKLTELAGITTSTAKDEIDFLRGPEKKPLWLRIYLKDEPVMYEGWLIGHDLEQGRNRFIILSKYRKYGINPDKTLGECMSDYDSDEEKVVIYYDNMACMEKRDAE